MTGGSDINRVDLRRMVFNPSPEERDVAEAEGRDNEARSLRAPPSGVESGLGKSSVWERMAGREEWIMFVREMTETECFTALAQARLARLACASENQPYVVPLYLVYHDPFLYGFTTPGQKIEWLRANPRVCVEVDDIQSFDHWTSVIIMGRYEELPDSPEWGQERLRAYELLQQKVDWWEPGGAARGPHGSTRPTQAIYYRIRIDRITGRRAVPDVE
jgi:hypothetical protein